MCHLQVPGHNMRSCKVVLAQAKATKLTWPTVRGGGTGRVRFQGAKNRQDEGEELNDLVDNMIKEFLTTNKGLDYKASINSGSEDE